MDPASSCTRSGGAAGSSRWRFSGSSLLAPPASMAGLSSPFRGVHGGCTGVALAALRSQSAMGSSVSSSWSMVLLLVLAKETVLDGQPAELVLRATEARLDAGDLAPERFLVV